ncbi:MAG: hypothetical protein COY40_02595 [Alphaproteobacteria bacterium CG_4_10_14_0_8_um_filter_53_9]|nr:MAG: hypothetical protein COY40_02595 [Alphaproteobacteria bacterium CG_4_10_14_0_8_um_filter_53_9]
MRVLGLHHIVWIFLIGTYEIFWPFHLYRIHYLLDGYHFFPRLIIWLLMCGLLAFWYYFRDIKNNIYVFDDIPFSVYLDLACILLLTIIILGVYFFYPSW